jgi:hypothetical protein
VVSGDGRGDRCRFLVRRRCGSWVLVVVGETRLARFPPPESRQIRETCDSSAILIYFPFCLHCAYRSVTWLFFLLLLLLLLLHFLLRGSPSLLLPLEPRFFFFFFSFYFFFLVSPPYPASPECRFSVSIISHTSQTFPSFGSLYFGLIYSDASFWVLVSSFLTFRYPDLSFRQPSLDVHLPTY